jgi:hypothetical protein
MCFIMLSGRCCTKQKAHCIVHVVLFGMSNE